MIRVILAILAAIVEILRWIQAPAPAQTLKPLTPVDAVGAIADAMRSAPVIALSPGAGHGDARGPAFIVTLIRDPRITALPTDLVVEGANGRYQDAMDR